MNIYETKIWKKFTQKTPNQEQLYQIQQIIHQFKIKSHQIRIIAEFCEVDLKGNWLDAYSKVVQYIQIYGGKHTLELFQLRYGIEEGLLKYKNNKFLKSNTRESFIRRYGYLEGLDRYNSFCLKNKGNKTIDRFIKKYGKEEGVIKFNNLKHKEKNKGTKDYFISKYGEGEGCKIYEKKISALNFGASTLGFVSKYGEVDGLKRIKESKNNTSLLSYQKRYGVDNGLYRYNKFIAKKRFNNTLESYILRYGELEGKSKYENWLSTSALGVSSYSKISQELFDMLDSQNPYVYYATKNKEFVMNTDTGVYFFDYVNIKTKKIIEFNGDIFHGNPTIYSITDTPHPYKKNRTCEEMWYYDEIKIKQATTKNYDVLVIWEKDYRIDKNNEINKCKAFLGI